MIARWVLAAIGVIATSPGLATTTDESSFLPKHYESIRAADLRDKAFPQAHTSAAIMVFSRKDGSTLTTADSAKAKQITKVLGIERIEAITPASASKNKLVQTSMAGMTKKLDYNDKLVTDAIKTLRDDAKPCSPRPI